MRNRPPALIAVSLIILISAFMAYRAAGCGCAKQGAYLVKQAVDGDTILLATGERVRYIGINTPETKHPHKGIEAYGEEAARFNKKLVEGKWVTLEFDAQKRDRYGRLLAYVYVDGMFVNAKLVEDGYAQVYTFPPNVKHAELFIRLQRGARGAGRGLWAAER